MWLLGNLSDFSKYFFLSQKSLKFYISIKDNKLNTEIKKIKRSQKTEYIPK